ncbi:MAG: hypothetical protein K2L67_06285 [Clostridia bacterium]|nr:hypothetical protein [Clostridia bacterium]
MKIKEIVTTALNLLGRADVAKALENGEELLKEANCAAETVLYCVNAVLDELARYYFPLTFKETLYLTDGRVAFKDFSVRPVKLLKVTANGREIAFGATPQYLTADGAQIEVEYEYSPDKKPMDGDCDYAGVEVGARLIAAGAASEYCILNGEAGAAEYWEGEYRREIDRARAKFKKPLKIPPRRWV